MINLMLGDCLERMKEIPDGSVDMILCDLPYGTTACKWDVVIPFEPLWSHYKRIIKDRGAIVLFGNQPFTTLLIASNIDWFSYEWIYEKTNAKNPMLAKYKPLGSHESVIIFSRKGLPVYYPIMWEVPTYLITRRKSMTEKSTGEAYGGKPTTRRAEDQTRFPTSVIGFSNRVGRLGNFHPTQKPVALMEYLIKTYTNEGETVLDNCMGSGTVGVACKNLNRKFIGIEKDETYFKIAQDRIAAI